jgi:AcrR family transcriptional regulator
MRTKTRKPVAGALDRTAYFNAAFKILGESGAEGLTVDTLCARLGATKGSFYHLFAGTADFVNALMRCWVDSATQLIAELKEMVIAEGDPCRTMERIIPQLAVRQPHEAEAALRAWANSNPEVAAGVESYDRAREESFVWMFGQFVDDPERCRTLAYMAIGMGAGMQQRRPLDRDRMMAVTVEFLRANIGLDVQLDHDETGPRLRIAPPKKRRPRPA